MAAAAASTPGAARAGNTTRATGPRATTDEPPASTIIVAPAGGNGILGMLARPALEATASGRLSTRVVTITDGTYAPVERSKDPDWNRATYSGKKKGTPTTPASPLPQMGR